MKRIVISTVFVFVFAFAMSAQSTCTRHVEPTGGFSYCPPDGSSSKDRTSGGPFKSFVAPANGSLKANLNVRTETTTASHEVYMVAALRLLLDGNESRGAEARKIVGWTKFTTDSNLTGSRMAYEMLYQGLQMRTLQVILEMPGKKLIFTGTALASDKDMTDKIFDGVAKSISLSR